MLSLLRKLFLALKKVRIVKISPPQVPFTWSKIPPSRKILDSPHPFPLLGKPCIFYFDWKIIGSQVTRLGHKSQLHASMEFKLHTHSIYKCDSTSNCGYIPVQILLFWISAYQLINYAGSLTHFSPLLHFDRLATLSWNGLKWSYLQTLFINFYQFVLKKSKQDLFWTFVGCGYHTQSSALSFEKIISLEMVKRKSVQRVQTSKMPFFKKNKL